MKKVLCLLFVVFFLTSCAAPSKTVIKQGKLKEGGVWISYYEITSMLKSKKGFKEEFSTVIKNCKTMKIQNLYIHTRAFGDSLYASEYFPLRQEAEDYDFDIFGYIVGECKKEGLRVHAWINPYRISSAEDIDKTNPQCPAYKWLNDDDKKNDGNISFANGIYLNPASEEVRCLILDSIRELIAKYDVGGIHFDDYFYPTQSEEFDKILYDEYKKKSEVSLSLADWRRANVNILIESCHNTIKYANENIVFSISPAASIEHNFENLYADVVKWADEEWIDEVIPQLYFGFEYPDKSFRFENLLKTWEEVARQTDVTLKIGLACYKAVPSLSPDKAEWRTRDDIIARQVEICEKSDCVGGYVYFSYSSLYGNKKAYTAQREKILEYLETEKTNE